MGVLVSKGELLQCKTSGVGYYLIGFSEDNILKILPVSGLSENEVKELIANEKIRDAVTFQEEASDANNHFVKLIINGEERETNGLGSGANPRTAIGQREDGGLQLNEIILGQRTEHRNGEIAITRPLPSPVDMEEIVGVVAVEHKGVARSDDAFRRIII